MSTEGPVPNQRTSSRQKRLRHSEGWALRKWIMQRKNRKTSWLTRSRSQSSQLVVLSWLYGLLLPPCVCRNSSPARNIGVPFARKSRQQKFLAWRLRSLQHAAGAILVPFPAAVPAIVLLRAVGIVVAVGLVAFPVVGDEVVQGEPVVGRDVVDALVRMEGCMRSSGNRSSLP